MIQTLHTPKQMREELDTMRTYVADVQRVNIKNSLEITRLQSEVHELTQHFTQSGFIYVGSPYTHTSIRIEEQRYRNTMWYVVGLLRQRQWAFSPILHCHDMAQRFSLPKDALHWMDYNFAMLSAARELHVLQLPGWESSVGLKSEVAFWRHSRERPVKFIDHATEINEE